MSASRQTSGRLRRLVGFGIAALVAAGVASPVAAAAPPPNDTQSLRNGMTWTVLGQQGGAVHVGSDAQTSPYGGDTAVDQYLPVLCLNVDGRGAPGGMTFDFYNGWALGSVKATAAVRGDALSSPQAADALCAQSFGAGWRQGEFHDGRYGDGFTQGGGWTFWASGQLAPGTRFWAKIGDQPANPWNSAGELPAPVTLPEDDIAVKSRLQEMTQPVLSFAQSPAFRNVVDAGVSRQFDGDDNVLLSTVISDAEASGAVNAGSAAWQTFKAQVAEFASINGHSYYPQLYIPNHNDGAVPGATVTMTVMESDLSRTTLPSYQVDAGGALVRGPQVDENYVETHEVWVLSTNERIQDDVNPAAAGTATTGTTTGTAKTADSSSAVAAAPACNPTGMRNNMGLEFTKQFKIPSPSSVEHWTAGKVEPQMIVVGKGGAEIKNAYFGKIKRKNVKNWIVRDLYLTMWDRAQYGDYWAFKWVELDGGPKVEINLKLAPKILEKLGISLDVKATWDKKYDDMGSSLVNFIEPTSIEYSTGTAYWMECTMGGDGGTGHDNIGRSAFATAQSTFPGYSVAKVNDGSTDTALGGEASWANADAYGPDGYLPQWVQLDFTTARSFNKVVVYTTASYPMKSFDVQVWDGLQFRTVAATTTNGGPRVEFTFPTQTSRLVRILARQGPDWQPQYVRVNEFEVYN
jgi:hypothetical protein